MWPNSRIAAVSMALLFARGVCFSADRIELFTGEVFEGEILRQDRNEVSIRLKKGGAVSFRRAQVRRIRRNGEDPVEAPRPEDQSSAKQPGQNPTKKSEAVKNEPAAPAGQEPSGAAKANSQAAESGAGRKTVELLSEIPIVDETNGFQMTLPAGFLPWAEGRLSPVAHAYRDPVTEASLTIAAYQSTEPLPEVKKSAAQAYARHFDRFKLARDEPLAGLPQSAWVLELTSSLGGVEVHQMQVFTGAQGKVVVLTYTTTAQFDSRYRDAFMSSVQSFRFLTEKRKTEERK